MFNFRAWQFSYCSLFLLQFFRFISMYVMSLSFLNPSFLSFYFCTWHLSYSSLRPRIVSFDFHVCHVSFFYSFLIPFISFLCMTFFLFFSSSYNSVIWFPWTSCLFLFLIAHSFLRISVHDISLILLFVLELLHLIFMYVMTLSFLNS
jgi:hypothetical protein